MSFQPFEGGGILGALYGVNKPLTPLSGIFGPQPQNQTGLLGEEAAKRSRMAMAAALLQASGPSPQKIGFGQALGGALMAGQQASDQARQQALQEQVLQKKL